MSATTTTIGIDIGSGAVKSVLFRTEGDRHEWIAKRCERIRRRDPMTLAYFRELEARVAMERDPQASESVPDSHEEPAPDVPAEAIAAIVDLLHEAGALPPASRPLLESPQTSVRLTRIRACLQSAHDCDPGAYASRSAELAYLANVIVAEKAERIGGLRFGEYLRVGVPVAIATTLVGTILLVMMRI